MDSFLIGIAVFCGSCRCSCHHTWEKEVGIQYLSFFETKAYKFTWHLFSFGGFIFDPTGQLKSREKSSMLENGPWNWKRWSAKARLTFWILSLNGDYLDTELVRAVNPSEHTKLKCLWSVFCTPDICSGDLKASWGMGCHLKWTHTSSEADS